MKCIALKQTISSLIEFKQKLTVMSLLKYSNWSEILSGGKGCQLEIPCGDPTAQNHELQQGWRLI